MKANTKSLRLVFPQWQGGTLPQYYLGAKLLSFLAPEAKGPVEEISVAYPDKTVLKEENGIFGRHTLIDQLQQAENILEKHKPESIVILGGDCLVDLVPFAYLTDLYRDDLGILWIDAHPDVMTPEQFNHGHAMVMGNLLGKGDKDFTRAVKTPIKPSRVMYAGLGATLPYETEFIEKNSIQFASPGQLAQNSDPVIEWIKANHLKKLAIHFDLDVIHPACFHSLYFSDPSASPEQYEGITRGQMKLETVQRLINDVQECCSVVGLGITEYLPWDAYNLIQLFKKLPLLGD